MPLHGPLVSLACSLVLTLAFTTPGHAQQAPVDADDPASADLSAAAIEGLEQIDAIIVGGRQPGPGLWKISRGDHVLWILGAQNPLPKRMEWDSSQVERRIAESQEVLLSPTVTFDADIGFFRGMMLLPKMLKARRNPDGRTLSEIVTPEQYARWTVLKKRYIGGDRGVEEWRPLFAAGELYAKAIAHHGMTQSALVSEVVGKTAKRAKVPTATPKIEIKIPNIKAVLQDFAAESLQDTDCFAKTLQRIDSDLDMMVARANAWAQGDIEALRDRQALTQWAACSSAMTGNAVARKLGFVDIEQRLQAKWLESAEAALARNTSTFAVLPISQMFSADGYLAKLTAKGYVIEEP